MACRCLVSLRLARPLLRFNSTSTQAKVPLALISSIRIQRPGTPLSLARSALQATDNDVSAALEWIAKQAVASGTAKAEKLKGRTATEGLIAVAVLSDGTKGDDHGVRAAMVELSCETDFVARTDEFATLAGDLARSIAFFADTSPATSPLSTLDVESIGATPLVPPATGQTEASPNGTVSQAVAAMVSRLGENISLRRASAVAIDPPTILLVSPYIHLPRPGSQAGVLASLVLLNGATDDKLARALARQVAAVPTEQGTLEELRAQTLVTLPSTDGSERTVQEALGSGDVEIGRAHV